MATKQTAKKFARLKRIVDKLTVPVIILALIVLSLMWIEYKNERLYEEAMAEATEKLRVTVHYMSQDGEEVRAIERELDVEDPIYTAQPS